MRIGVKIKVTAVFLAWLATFAHSVIPHNHVENYNSTCNRLVHSCTEDAREESKNSVLHSVDTESSVCHISNFLFHSLNAEDFFPYTNDNISISPLSCAKIIYSDTDHSFLSNYSYSASHLRAPPVA